LDVLGARLETAMRADLDARAAREVQQAYEAALAAPVADPDIIWKDIYA
jgi:hypothetical protein